MSTRPMPRTSFAGAFVTGWVAGHQMIYLWYKFNPEDFRRWLQQQAAAEARREIVRRLFYGGD